MLGDNTMACSAKVFIGKSSAQQGKDPGMSPVMGQGSSCMGGAWGALAELPWMLALDPDPAVYEEETSSSLSSTAAQVWKSPAACQCTDCSGSPGKAPSQGRDGPAELPSLLWHRNHLPGQPIPTAGSGSKWRWPRPSCCQGQRLPRRNCPQRRIPGSQGSGTGCYSPSESSQCRRTPSPNGERGHQQSDRSLPVPDVPRLRVMCLLSPSWVGCPITGGDSHDGLKPLEPSGWQRDGQRQGQHQGRGA